MKTLVFCTSYHASKTGWDDRQAIWIRALRASRLHFDQLLIVDDASPHLPDWPDVEIVHQASTPGVEDLVSAAPILLYTHTERLGRASVFDFPGWYRSFAFGVLYGAAHGFEKIIHIESDAFLISDRIQDHFNAFTSGWFACWCEAYHFPEIAIQAAAGGEIATMAAFVREPYSRLEGQVHELLFPLTHVERNFVGDRYGEQIGHIPRHADFSTQTHSGQPDSFYWWITQGQSNGAEPLISLERRRGPFGRDMLEGSWSGAEDGYNWMLDFDSSLFVPPVSAVGACELRLEINPCLYQDRTQQRLFVLVNDRLVDAVTLYRATTIRCRIEPGLLRASGFNHIRFLHPDAFAPADIGPHTDRRRLSIALAGYELLARDRPL